MRTTTVLLDLDDTLLGNNMEHFLPPYFATLAARLHQFAQGQDLRRIVVASVQVVHSNQNPAISNLATFMIDFARRLGCPLEAIHPVIDVFYREDYPLLRQYTVFRPEARQVVQRLVADDYKVVIATNPLFPATAIEQRLAWAGVADFPYAWVSTMENSHFCKPHPHYYQEILSKVASDPAATWMVGDDLYNDIVPASTLGMKTWWITDNVAMSSIELPETPVVDQQGSLADFLAWVEAGGLS